jgi:uncharacterized protein YyaL (SSP411 family)
MGRRFHVPIWKVLALTAIVGVQPVTAGAEPADKDRPANRLARETSPYLREHAHNPVDWYPWGPEAFARAQKENKLIFLSVGYSSCHWCHVMARETFSNADMAKLLNSSFVCIKVDREERPDVDQICQLAVQLLDEPSGWPLSMFLTPDGKPIAGRGMFMPPDDRVVDGRRLAGLKPFIRAILDAKRDHGKEVNDQADHVARTISLAMSRAGRSAGPEPRRYLVTAAVDGFKEEFDSQFGGFGNPKTNFNGSKFPMTPALGLLLQQAGRQNSDQLLGMVTKTLDHMAAGGIYDQLGGGFHRYSVERTWTVPHFEKMLSDNAQLVELYARAFERTKNPVYRRVVEEALAFVGRELTAPDGGFFTALDADSDGEEGRFYLWTAAQIDAALPDRSENALARTAFGVGDAPMLEGKYFVLTRPDAKEPADPHLADIRQKLFVARSSRARPFLDTKIITAWNGQMIAAYAVAGRIMAEPRFTESAARAADFVLKNLRTIDGRLMRTFSAVPGETPKASLLGYLDDYALFTDGLLSLHDATGDARWLTEARALTDLMIRYHGDEAGGFYYTASDHEKMFARGKDVHDAAQPAGNSVAVRNLLRLAAKTGEARYRDLADKTLRTFAVELEQNPTALPTLAADVDQFLEVDPPAAKPVAQPPADGGPKKSDSVVKTTVAAEKSAGGKQTVTITLIVDKDWHIYANPVGNADQESSATTVVVSANGKPVSAKIDYPKGKLIKDPLVGDYNIYDGKIEIKAIVDRAAGDTGPLEISVKLQACNDSTCLQPATVKLKAP